MKRFADGWLSERDIRPGAGVRLFCLPHAGSGAAAFYRWKRLVAPEIDICPILLPGREMRLAEASLVDAEAVVDELMRHVSPHLDAPFAIFGHSMGALLAFAWARRIEAAGLCEPHCLFVSGREAAHLPFGHRALHRLEDAAVIAELKRRYGGMEEDFWEVPELREVFLPILRADLTVVESYRHAGGRLRCPIMAFAGVGDRSVSAAGLTAWGELTTGEFASRRLAGDHFSHTGTGQTELLRAIAERLAGDL
jgi:medium-chain acyl-[acyl-carrier-protein] hydrolase